MPLISIRSRPPSDRKSLPLLIAKIRQAGAEALPCDVSNIWVIFDFLEDPFFVLGEADFPLVRIQAQSGRTEEQRRQLTTAVAKELSKGLEIPFTNIWIHYEEMNPKDVWFRGSFGV